MPNWSASQWGSFGGHAIFALVGTKGLGGTKAIGSTLGFKAAKTGTEGGLNLFKIGKPTTTTAEGWKIGDRMLNMYDKGSPKLNWKQNSSYLRKEMRSGNPIYDSYRYPNGRQIPTGGFLNAERKLLENRGWRYNPLTGAYQLPR